jgi:hypothetical protein
MASNNKLINKMDKSNQFGLKNNESGPIHDHQIALNELQLKLTKTENKEREFRNLTPKLEFDVEKQKNILARSNRLRLANNSKRLYLTREVIL